jgi:hypothetical protein
MAIYSSKVVDVPPVLRSVQKKFGSFEGAMNTDGCCERYVNSAVVPHLGAPTIKKCGIAAMNVE